MPDIFDRLSEVDVPPPPEEFDRELHERVNKTLLAVQIVDFAVRAMPWAMLHFARALVDLVMLSVTAQHVSDRSHKRDR